MPSCPFVSIRENEFFSGYTVFETPENLSLLSLKLLNRINRSIDRSIDRNLDSVLVGVASFLMRVLRFLTDLKIFSLNQLAQSIPFSN